MVIFLIILIILMYCMVYMKDRIDKERHCFHIYAKQHAFTWSLVVIICCYCIHETSSPLGTFMLVPSLMHICGLKLDLSYDVFQFFGQSVFRMINS